jgi:hypothetical protein
MSCSRRSWLALVGLLVLSAAAPAADLPPATLDKLLPDDTQVVFTVNVRQLLDSAVVKKYVLGDVQKALDTEAAKVLRLLGLNPIKEVDGITVATPGGADQGKWLAIVTGSFDPAKLRAGAEQFAQAHPDAVAVSKVDGVPVYEDLTKDKQSSAPRYFALLGKQTVIASPAKEYVAEAIAKAAGKRPAKLDAGLRTLIARQDLRQSLWLAAVTSKEMRQQLAKNAGGGLKDFADKIQSVSGGLTVTDEIRLNVRVQTSDANAARMVRQQLEADKAIAVLAVSVRDELKDYAPTITDVLNAFRFSQDQGAVSVELTVAANLIDKGVKR